MPREFTRDLKSGLCQDPPRETRSMEPSNKFPSFVWYGYGKNLLRVHSETLPIISQQPNGLSPSGLYDPTRVVFPFPPERVLHL